MINKEEILVELRKKVLVNKSKLENIREIIEELHVMTSLKGLDIVLKEIDEILSGEDNE